MKRAITIEGFVDFRRGIDIIKKNKLWLFIFIAISMITMSVYLKFFAVPIYKSSAQVLVNQTESNELLMQVQNVQTNLDLIDTYNVIIKSPRILEKVSKELNNSYSENELSEMIKVSNATNSQIIEISVEGVSPELTINVANTTADVFRKEIASIMKVNNVTVLTTAKINQSLKPIKPNKKIMLFFSFFIGIVCGISYIFFKTLFDRTLKNSEEIQNLFELRLLGSVGDMDEKKRGRNLKNGKKSKKD